MLGGFDVVVDGRQVPAAEWRRRQAAALVKMLALVPGRSLHRERVIDALWPDLDVDDAAPRLHKAAHYARRSLGEARSVVLDGETVALFPDARVDVDAQEFERLAEAALAAADPRAAGRAADAYGGDLLPQDLYEPWTEAPRDRLRLLYLQVLRLAERWEALTAADPGDEHAHLALIRRLAEGGDRRAAMRQFERLERGLRRELGVAPSETALRLRDELLAVDGAAAGPPSGRGVPRGQGQRARRRRPAAGRRPGRDADARCSSPAPPASGKTALLTVHRGRGGRAAHAGRHGDRRDDRGRLAVRAGPGGAGRPVPAPSDAARRARRRVPRRDRAGAVGPAVQLGRPGCAPAAVRRRGRAAPAGRRGRRRGPGDRRRARRRRRQPAAAALPGAQHDHGAAAHRDRTPARRRRRVRRRASQPPRAPQRRHARPGPAVARGRRRAGAAARARRPTRPCSTRSTRASGGLPFAVVELARAVAADGPPATRTLVPAGLSAPALQRAHVRRRARLRLRHRRVHRHDRPVRSRTPTRRWTRRSTGGSCTARSGGYAFRHALVRESLLETAGPDDRRAAHLRAAQTLERLGRSPARIGHHLVQAGEEPRSGAVDPDRGRDRGGARRVPGRARDAADRCVPPRPARTSRGCSRCGPTCSAPAPTSAR